MSVRPSVTLVSHVRKVQDIEIPRNTFHIVRYMYSDVSSLLRPNFVLVRNEETTVKLNCVLSKHELHADINFNSQAVAELTRPV